jgi:hypothetical protein
MIEKIQKDCLKGGYCEVSITSIRRYNTKVLTSDAPTYKCSKCEAVYYKTVTGKFIELSHRMRRTRTEMQTELTLSQIQDEYIYITRVNSVAVVRNSFKDLLAREILNKILKEEITALSELLDPHLDNIATYLKTQDENDYRKIVENNSLVVLDNTCTYLYMTFVFGALNSAPNKLTKYMQDEAYPFIMKMKSQSDNIVNYFRMIKPENL